MNSTDDHSLGHNGSMLVERPQRGGAVKPDFSTGGFEMATSRTIGRQTSNSPALLIHGRYFVKVAATIVANIALFMVLFQLYKMVRKTFIQRGESVGYHHAEQIISLQKRLHILIEPHLQSWIIPHHWLIRGLNWYYAGFMWSFYGCCVIAIALAPARFRFYRRVFLLSMLFALPWYAIYPLAPPRFMPQYGFVDTLKEFGPNYFSNGGLVTANQYAAMPSMHIGWTTIGVMMLAAAIPYRRIGLIIGLTHLSIMTITVMATANHYLLDAVGGWLIITAALVTARLLPTPVSALWRRLPAIDEEPEPVQSATMRPSVSGISAQR